MLHETRQYLLRNILLKAHRAFVSQMQQNVNSEVSIHNDYDSVYNSIYNELE